MKELQVAYIEKQQRVKHHQTGPSLYLVEIVRVIQLREQTKCKTIRSGSHIQQK